MGYDRHHAIVVTGFRVKDVEKAHTKASEIFGDGRVSPVLRAPMNSWFSFFIGPDGSKEWWPESDLGDERRKAFITYMLDRESGYLDWAEIQYGDDERETKICRHSDEDWEVRET